MKPGRIPCCVLGCGRTAAADKHPGCEEIICGKHWRTVSKGLKRQYRTANQRIRKILRKRPGHAEYWLYPPGSPQRLSAHAMWARSNSIWKQIKAEAIEIAMGIR